MLGALGLALVLSLPAQDTAHLVIAATTDVHGHATGWDYLNERPFPGGLARAATAIDSLRRLYPGQVVVVDAGDLIQGDPFATYFAQVAPRDPHPVIDAMNLMGYDAATPGNHEFNFGLDFFNRAAAGAAFHYLSANIVQAARDRPLLRPFAVINRAGLRVGVTGFTTPGVMVWDRGLVRGRIRVKRFDESMPGVLATISDSADFTLVLSHSGLGGPSSYDTTDVGAENVSAVFADVERPPHLVVVGHTHRQMPVRRIDGVYYMQPPPHARGLAVAHVRMLRRLRGWELLSVEGEIIPLENRPEDQRILRRLARDHENVVQWLAEPLAFATAPMLAKTARVEATPIINLINEVQRRRTGAQLSATAAFNPSGGFPGGDVLLSHVAGLYPYENTLKAIRITGAQLKAYLEQSARYFAVDRRGNVTPDPSIPGYNFDIVGGAEYIIDLRLPAGDRIRNLQVNGRPVRPADTFTMAINSYRQAGGGGFDMLAGAPVVYDQGEGIRELLVDAVRAMGTIDPTDYAARQWRIDPPETAAKLRVQFGGSIEGESEGPAPDRTLLRVLAINDFAGAVLVDPGLEVEGPAAGAVGLEAMMDSAEAACDCAALRLDAGNQLRGQPVSSLVRGRATVDVFNHMRIAASVPGVRDFGWSLDTLRQRMAESKYPWLIANLFDAATGRRPPWAEPYRIFQAGPLTIAVIGYLTPGSGDLLPPADRPALRLAGPDVVRDLVAEMRRQRVDVTIVLAHAGPFCEGRGCQHDLVELAELLAPEGVGLILAGGSPEPADTVVAGVRIVEARNRGNEVAVVDLVETAVGGRHFEARLVPVTARTEGEGGGRGVGALLDRYRARADTLAALRVGTVKTPVRREGAQHGVGNLIADAFQNVLRTDLAVIDNASISGDLPAGLLQWGRVLDVLPRQSTLVVLDVTGATLFRLFELAVADGRPAVHVSGARVRYDPTKPIGSRVREIRLTRKGKVKANGVYSLAVPDYLVGDPAWGIPPLTPGPESGVIDSEAFRLYIRRLPQPVVAPIESRIESTRR